MTFKAPFQPKLVYDCVVSGAFTTSRDCQGDFGCAFPASCSNPVLDWVGDPAQRKKKTLWHMVGNCCFKTKSAPRRAQLHSHPNSSDRERDEPGGAEVTTEQPRSLASLPAEHQGQPRETS